MAAGFLVQAGQAGSGPLTAQLALTDRAASASSLHAAGVTLCTTRAFNASSLGAASALCAVTLPAGARLPVAVLVKTASSDGGALFNVTISSPPSAAARPVSSASWMTAVTGSGAGGASPPAGTRCLQNAGLLTGVGLL